jgi:hypothetical protein
LSEFWWVRHADPPLGGFANGTGHDRETDKRHYGILHGERRFLDMTSNRRS